MKLLKRLVFAIRHDFDHEYLVVDPETPNYVIRCNTYEGAVNVRSNFTAIKPWYGMAKIMVAVRKKL